MDSAIRRRFGGFLLEEPLSLVLARRVPAQTALVSAASRAVAEDRFPFSTGGAFDVDGGCHLRRL
jgi:3-oxoacyl-[acyl-carrier protein] reductase